MNPPAPGLRRPRAILFDLFHTLVDVNAAPGLTSSEILGIDPRVWNRKIIEESVHHALGTVLDRYESVRIVVHSIDPAIPEERIRRAVQERPARFRHALLRVRAEILSGLRELQGLGLKFALLSNAGLDEVEAWPDSPLAPFFAAALFSCHEHLMKPDPAFYRLAAERLDVPPEECLFVGDGGSREHAGAREAGMRTVLMLGLLRESLPEIATQRPQNTDWQVETMAELVEMVRGWEP